MTTPSPITTPVADPLADLAMRIRAAHTEVVASTKNVIQRALACGELLNEAKAKKTKHGEWLPWLRANCPDISERTAQVYMKLARHKAQVEAMLQTKSADVADLTLDKADQALAEMSWAPCTSTSGSSSSGTIPLSADRGSVGRSKPSPSDAYDKAEEKLIEKLEALPLSEAEAAVTETINQLNKVLASKKKAVKVEKKVA